MPARKGKCIHFGGCTKADNREIVEVQPGEDFVCTACGKPLVEVQEGAGVASRKKKMALAATAVAVVAAFAVWVLRPGSRGPGQREEPRTAETQKSKESPAEASPCGLKPASEVDVSRLLAYMKQGMIYVSHNRYDLALKEFEQVQLADPNFLAVRGNIAAAQLKLRKLSEAEANLQEEIRLIGCLEQMNDSELTTFAYMLEVQQKPDASSDLARAQTMRERLRQARAAAHYNLACIRALQGSVSQAIRELGEAVAHGFADVSALRRDPDLAQARSAPEFQQVLNAASKNAGPRGE